MSETSCETLDPRIRRTRQLLQQALGRLLETKEFERISVQDIAEAATLNRATFYAHYPDRFALLECLVEQQFNALLEARGVVFQGGCGNALRGIVLGVCDYLAARPRLACERQWQMEPHLEASVIAVVRRMLLNGLQTHTATGRVPVEMMATTASWAIFGAAKEWVHTPQRCSSEEILEIVVQMVAPILALAVS
jgi:AcrR family transcriptional regulator